MELKEMNMLMSFNKTMMLVDSGVQTWFRAQSKGFSPPTISPTNSSMELLFTENKTVIDNQPVFSYPFIDCE